MIVWAELLCYLTLYRDGGIYSDIDMREIRPIETWIPDNYKGWVNVVIGLEIDEPGTMWLDWADNFAFCQSTMMASPGHRIYKILIDSIIRNLGEAARIQSANLAELDLSFQDVLHITGPVAFTGAVFEYLTVTVGEPITRANFSGIDTPKRVADVLVMPTVAFVPGQQHSKSGSAKDKEALVEHFGMGSWRGAHTFDADLSGKSQGHERKARGTKNGAR